jgi:hypothetical protein
LFFSGSAAQASASTCRADPRAIHDADGFANRPIFDTWEKIGMFGDIANKLFHEAKPDAGTPTF